MADETTLNTPATGEVQATQSGATEATTTDTAQADGDIKLFTQADLDRIATKVRGEEKTRQERETTRLKQLSEHEQLAKQGEYKTLHEQSESRVRDLENEVLTLRADNLRASVAIKHHLPEDIGRLLQGDTKEQMEAHAVKLAKHMAPPVAPNTEGGVQQAQETRTLAQKKTAESIATAPRYANF
jgi:hypothetical protein